MKYPAYNPKKSLTNLLVGTSVAATVLAGVTLTSRAAFAEELASDEPVNTTVPEVVTTDTSLASTSGLPSTEADTTVESSQTESAVDGLSDQTQDAMSETDTENDETEEATASEDPIDADENLTPVESTLSTSTSVSTSATSVSNRTIEDGVYTISTYSDSSKVFETASTYSYNTNNVQIATQDSAQNQRWKIKYNTSYGYYSIFVNGTNLALSIQNNKATNGANVYVSDNTYASSQLWKILQTDGGFKIVSALNENFVVDLTYGSTKIGNNIELYTSNGNPYSQTFSIKTAMSEVLAKDSIREGIYSIHAQNSSSSLVLSTSKTGVQLANKANITSQRIYIQSAGDGFYRLIAESDGTAIAVSGGSSEAGATIARESIYSSPSQLWAVQKNSDGSICFINRAGGLVLDIYNGIYRSSIPICAWTKTGSGNQKFYLESLANVASGSATIVDDDTYFISTSNSNLQLQATSATLGATVTLAQAQGTSTQRWTIKRVSNTDYYTIGLTGTDYVLDIYGARPSNEEKVILWSNTGAANQQWKFVQNSYGYMLVSALRPDLVIDLRYGSVKEGATVQTYTASGAIWQSFNLRGASQSVEGRVSIDEGIYTFTVGNSASSGYVLDVPMQSKADGTKLAIYTKNNNNNQKFLIKSVGDNYYNIVNINSGLALDAFGNGVTAGTDVIQWYGNDGINQQWAFVNNGDGSYRIVNRLSGLVLDVQYGIIANSSAVELYYSKNSINQKWWLQKDTYLNEGLYEISVSTGQNLVWDIPQARSDSGVQAALYTANNQINQRYQVVKGTKDQTFKIRSGSSGGWIADVNGTIQQVGTSATSETSNMLWTYGWNGKYITLVNVGTGRTLSVQGGLISGSKLITKSSSLLDAAQGFTFKQASLLQSGTTYTFVNKQTGGRIISENGSITNGSNAVATAKNSSSFDKFLVTVKSDGTIKLTNSLAKLCLDVMYASKTSGANVILYTDNGANNQAWRAEIADGGGIILRNVNSNLSLAVDTSNGNVVQSTYNKSDTSQIWVYTQTTPSSRLNGVDISSWDAGLNISNLSGDFVIIKTTQGTHYLNPEASKQVSQALSAGKLIGFYHYAEGGDPVAEATYFYNSVKNYIGKAILVLDWESQSNTSFGKKDVAWSKSFLDTLYKLSGGVRGFMYVSKSVTYAHDWSSVASNYPLWVAQYADMKTITGYQTNPWTDNKGYGAWSVPTIFQYSSMGKPEGWNLSKTADLDVFYGSSKDWLYLASRR